MKFFRYSLVFCTLPMLALATLSAQTAKLNRGTADYYLADAEKYEGKTVSLSITGIYPSELGRAGLNIPEGHTLCEMPTVFSPNKTTREAGGTMYVLVPKAKEKLVLKRYNQKTKEVNKEGRFYERNRVMTINGKLVKLNDTVYAVQIN